MALVLDSGAVSHLARRCASSAALITALRQQGLWPPQVPSAVLIECLTGDGSRDALANRLLKACAVLEQLPAEVARRAAALRTRALHGSGIDALVVATAEPGGAVLTSDAKDLRALAGHARGVTVHVV